MLQWDLFLQKYGQKKYFKEAGPSWLKTTGVSAPLN
jgi:hypothetical protein